MLAVQQPPRMVPHSPIQIPFCRLDVSISLCSPLAFSKSNTDLLVPKLGATLLWQAPLLTQSHSRRQ